MSLLADREGLHHREPSTTITFSLLVDFEPLSSHALDTDSGSFTGVLDPSEVADLPELQIPGPDQDVTIPPFLAIPNRPLPKRAVLAAKVAFGAMRRRRSSYDSRLGQDATAEMAQARCHDALKAEKSERELGNLTVGLLTHGVQQPVGPLTEQEWDMGYRPETTYHPSQALHAKHVAADTRFVTQAWETHLPTVWF